MQKISRRMFTLGALGAGAALLTAPKAAALWAVETGTYVRNGVAVHYSRPFPSTGRPPIIAVHGGGHAAWTWSRYGPYFASRGWEFHALDWFHHGSSAQLPLDQFITRSITAIQQEIGIVAAEVGTPFNLIGHSMGALAALHTAQSLPPLSLVLVTPVVPVEVGAETIPIPVNLAEPFPVPPYDVAKSMFYSTMPDSEAQQYYPLLQQESPQAVYEATRWTVSVDLDAISMPTMTVAAAADTLTPPTAVSGLAGLLGSHHVEFPAIGHVDVLLKYHGWRPVAQEIEMWLRAYGLPSS